MAGPHLRTPLASPPDAERAAAHVLERCDELAAFSEEPDRLTRRFATRALWEAGEAMQQWMREAGMETWRDAIGNVVGRWEPSGGPLHGGAGSAPAPLQGAAGTD